MIHYHGTPITPRNKLVPVAEDGRNFCVSFAHPYDMKYLASKAQSIMIDNGAYSFHTKRIKVSWKEYYNFVEEYLCHPHWAVIPDIINADEEDQKLLLKDWPFPKELSAPVWHIHLSFNYLLYLCDNYPKICLGSSGKYWKIDSPAWNNRMCEIFDFLSQKRKYLPWIHGMRMLSQSKNIYPISSADSANVARNHNSAKKEPIDMVKVIDSKQPPLKWKENNISSFFEE